MIRNERGAALIIVLLTIVVIGLMSVALVNQVAGSHLQGQRAEEKVISKHNSGLGKVHFRQLVIDEVGRLPGNIADAGEILRNTFNDEIRISLIGPNGSEQNVRIDDVEVTPSMEDDLIQISYSSYGYYHNDINVEQETLILNLTTKEVEVPGWNLEGYDKKEKRVFNRGRNRQNYGAPNPTLTGNFHFYNTEFRGNSHVTVDGNLYISGDYVMVPPAKLTVTGDLIIGRGTNINLINNNDVCVLGVIHIEGLNDIRGENGSCTMLENGYYNNGNSRMEETTWSIRN
ncbi:hypothetical protein [Alteribacter keqinensis]|uniref:Uncharacterized protein n=1 Tax=Alteribacter keqinensis TaxID=2483800 RepID=A0A3M7TSY8_9BACI|nr:hypothetical protein [Alteribacter keqinensis]RNA68627.1 hypothetical protein EBO34_01270 [Alteribacter keqinensis]